MMEYSKTSIYMATGYKCVTDYWDLFTKADSLDASAVRETYRDIFGKAKSNVIHLTELTMVLNHKMFQHHEEGDKELCDVYLALWERNDQYAMLALDGDEMEYYEKTLD